MHSSPVLSLSPSFNSYSSSKVAEIAARVVKEFNVDDDGVFNLKDEEDNDSEFSFSFGDPDSSPISADDIFLDGQIRPTFPLFNTDLLLDHDSANFSKTPNPPSIRLPLRKLFLEERETPSCSSSEADELDGIQPGTYCVWRPNESSPGRCKKTNSAASSKRWKFPNILHRSNSDGKISFVFTKREEKVEKVAGDGDKNKGVEENVRRRSYLPYTQDLVGFFANVNGLSRNVHPF